MLHLCHVANVSTYFVFLISFETWLLLVSVSHRCHSFVFQNWRREPKGILGSIGSRIPWEEAPRWEPKKCKRLFLVRSALHFVRCVRHLFGGSSSFWADIRSNNRRYLRRDREPPTILFWGSWDNQGILAGILKCKGLESDSLRHSEIMDCALGVHSPTLKFLNTVWPWVHQGCEISRNQRRSITFH